MFYFWVTEQGERNVDDMPSTEAWVKARCWNEVWKQISSSCHEEIMSMTTVDNDIRPVRIDFYPSTRWVVSMYDSMNQLSAS